MPQCQGINVRGERCKRTNLSGQFCRYHTSSTQTSISTKVRQVPKSRSEKRSDKNKKKVCYIEEKINCPIRHYKLCVIPKDNSVTIKTQDCCVCLEPNVKKEQILSCSHSICCECLGNLRKDSCPMCRRKLSSSIVTKSVLKEINKRTLEDNNERNRENQRFPQELRSPNVTYVPVEILSVGSFDIVRRETSVASTYFQMIQDAEIARVLQFEMS